MHLIKIGIFGVLGVVLRYIIGLFFISAVSITLINLTGVLLMSLTHKFSGRKKDYFQTGFLGGFTSLSAIMVLKYSFIILLINLFLGLIIYSFTVKRV